MKQRLFLFTCALALGVACGKTGVFSNERFACASSGDCADGFVCASGECRLAGTDEDAGATGGGSATGGGVATGGGSATGGGAATGGGTADGGGSDGGAGDGGLRDAGVACTSTTSCLASLTCVDGVCCRSTCAGACDSCNQAGNLGTCLPRPAGSSTSTCSGYACDGVSTSCPTTCAVDAGVNACVPGFTCIAPTCGRCWGAVTDDFSQANDPVFTFSSASANVTGGRLVIAVMSRNGQPTTTAATSNETLPLKGCGVAFALEVPPTPTAGYEGDVQLFADNVTRRPAFGWRFDTRGVLAAWAFADGGVGEQVLVPAGTAPPRWLRVEESGGQVRWRTSTATTFTTVHSVFHAESLTGMKLEFSGSYPAQAGSDRTSYEVDSLNLAP